LASHHEIALKGTEAFLKFWLMRLAGTTYKCSPSNTRKFGKTSEFLKAVA